MHACTSLCHACGVHVEMLWCMRAQVCVVRMACVKGCTIACLHKYVSCMWRACRGALVHACTSMCHACGVRVGMHWCMRAREYVMRVASV